MNMYASFATLWLGNALAKEVKVGAYETARDIVSIGILASAAFMMWVGATFNV